MNENVPASQVKRALWKDDWDEARAAMDGWWKGTAPALCVYSPRDEPWELFEAPPAPVSLEQQWLDPDWRAKSQLFQMSRTFYGGAAFPSFMTSIGPGSLGLFLGAEGHLAKDTVWYDPCIVDPDACPSLSFRADNPWVHRHQAILAKAAQFAPGRYLVGYPDLIENIDTLAQIRGSQSVLMDLIERPEWVLNKIEEINKAYQDCYEWMLNEHKLLDAWGGTNYHHFSLWGTGLTSKVQCDFSCMISPRMFQKFVAPALREQCRWIDNAMYHLDGTQALPQLDTLLAIDTLNAIEWTPQAGLPQGGSAEWYGLYRKIRAAGKSVQAVGVSFDEVEPLIDAVGADGLMILTYAPTETQARDLLARCGWPGNAKKEAHDRP